MAICDAVMDGEPLSLRKVTGPWWVFPQTHQLHTSVLSSMFFCFNLKGEFCGFPQLSSPHSLPLTGFGQRAPSRKSQRAGEDRGQGAWLFPAIPAQAHTALCLYPSSAAREQPIWVALGLSVFQKNNSFSKSVKRQPVRRQTESFNRG